MASSEYFDIKVCQEAVWSAATGSSFKKGVRANIICVCTSVRCIQIYEIIIRGILRSMHSRQKAYVFHLLKLSELDISTNMHFAVEVHYISPSEKISHVQFSRASKLNYHLGVVSTRTVFPLQYLAIPLQGLIMYWCNAWEKDGQVRPQSTPSLVWKVE